MPSDPNAQQSSSTPSSSTRSKIEDAGRKAASAGSQVQDAAKTASKAVGTAVNGAADALGGVCGMGRISRGLTILMAAVAKVGQVCETLQPYSGSVCPRLVLEEDLDDQ